MRKNLARIDAKAFNALLGEELISIVDLGATGGIEPRWRKVTPFLNFFGFEPDSRSVDVNLSSSFGSYKLIPSLISNKS